MICWGYVLPPTHCQLKQAQSPFDPAKAKAVVDGWIVWLVQPEHTEELILMQE